MIDPRTDVITTPQIDASGSVAVVGAGPAGLCCALVLAGRGVRVSLIGPPGNAADTRTTALLHGAVEVLRGLDVWSALGGQAAALQEMAIIDGSRRLLRAPPVRFRAQESGLHAFGWNIPNGALTAGLEDAVRYRREITRLPLRANAIQCEADQIRITLEGGQTVEAKLAVAADGRASPTREAAGIASQSWTYPQTALAVSFRHSRPHRGVSTEFHTDEGPFTLVPLPGNRSSLVCVVRPDEARKLAASDDRELAREIERRSHGLLGSVTLDTARSLWPMAGLAVRRYADRRVALIGEAAHAFPPIGAQGFNLGFRDILALADSVAGARDPGAPGILDGFDRQRRADVATRTLGVDLLNRSLLSSFLPVHAARAVIFSMLRDVGPLRRLAMRQGLAPSQARA